jgi:N-acetylglucosamine-6-phosphate deacetylase
MKPDRTLVLRGDLMLPDRVLADGAVLVRGGRIAAVGTSVEIQRERPAQAPGRDVNDLLTVVDAEGGYIAPGYVDLHVHGGAGADFMDATLEAFETVLAAHARHGTTSLLPTTTVARHEQLLAVLELCRHFRDRDTGEPAPAGARVLGAHFDGPYFGYEARGCHPADCVRPPESREYQQYLEYADSIATATVAPELPGAEGFVRACGQRGVRTNAGHTHATFTQMAEAVRWGVRHVDHLFCAMSDKAKLRQLQPYPMQGGVLEATLYFDELTTEVIADGKHLSADLLLLALKIKGPDRLALATDCNRALDMPEGRYQFGPLKGGEPFDHRDGVGVMPDGKALASSVRGMDHMVRTFAQLTGRPLWEVVRMATLTPARIAGWDDEIGSLEVGKRADLLVLDRQLNVVATYLAGRKVTIFSN